MGLGLLGRGVGDVEFLAQNGADLIVTDLKTKKQLQVSLDRLKKFKKIKYVLGKHRLEDFKDRDMILKSAGVPLDSIYIKEAKKNKIPVEMSASLVAKLSDAKIIGITGTRGKSTVTQMIYEILKASKKKVFLGGNVRGIATLPLLESTKKGDYIVMELDSWQLQGFGEGNISPHIAVFTNLMRDHMNYYKGSMAKYFTDKANIYKYQKKGDYLIAGKEIARKIKDSPLLKPKKLPESWKLKVAGEHNRENASLAREVASKAGVSETIIKKTLANFKSVEGRLEYMKAVRGVKIYNDNNATTPDATIMALRALGDTSKNIVLIMGGADKNLDMKPLLKEIEKYCKSVVLLSGTGTDKLKNLKFEYKKANNLKDGIMQALKDSKQGDIVLFSPAFASFGLFENEYDRNDQFIELVKKLK